MNELRSGARKLSWTDYKTLRQYGMAYEAALPKKGRIERGVFADDSASDWVTMDPVT